MITIIAAVLLAASNAPPTQPAAPPSPPQVANAKPAPEPDCNSRTATGSRVRRTDCASADQRERAAARDKQNLELIRDQELRRR